MLLNQWCWDKYLTTNFGVCEWGELGGYFTPYVKVNSGWIQKLNIKMEL